MEKCVLAVFPGVNCHNRTNNGDLWLWVCIWEAKDYWTILPVSRTAVDMNKVPLVIMLIWSYTSVTFYCFTQCYNMNISWDSSEESFPEAKDQERLIICLTILDVNSVLIGIYSPLFFWVFFFNVCTIFKVFIEFVTVMLLLFMFCFLFIFFAQEACGILARWPGFKHMPPALEGKVLPLVHQGSPSIAHCLMDRIWRKKELENGARMRTLESDCLT